MSLGVRPRRSILYMPGSNERALTKGRTLPADGLIFDLEDAVAPEAKETARRQVVAALAEGGYGRREIFVRINGLDTSWGYDDLAAAVNADAILVPKVESADMVRRVAAIMDDLGYPAETAVWCMMETPLGILNAPQIAPAHRRLAGFVVGTSDLAKDLRCAHTPDRQPMITALGLCILAARGHGLGIIDGVYLDLADIDGFTAACRQGKNLGFDGKTLIHPKTIDIANQVFAPSDEELTQARAVIAAHAEAVAAGQGVVVLDGKLIENLHVAAAQRLVDLAQAVEQEDP